MQITRLLETSWFVSLFVIAVRGQLADNCPAQRQKMFDCLTMLVETTEEQDLAVAKKALTEEAGVQAVFLNHWEKSTKAFDKCRKLDPNFEKCSPTIATPPDFSNHSSYLLDKLDCVRNVSQNLEIVDMKEKFIGEIEAVCFDNSSKSRETLNDEPCRPNETVQRCLSQENLAITQDWLISQDKASLKLGKLFEEAKKEKLSRWRCYECVYLTSSECRPNEQQHDCISTLKRKISETAEGKVKRCMDSKGYKAIHEQIPPEMQMYANGRKMPKTDFCSWLKDDIRFY